MTVQVAVSVVAEEALKIFGRFHTVTLIPLPEEDVIDPSRFHLARRRRQHLRSELATFVVSDRPQLLQLCREIAVSNILPQGKLTYMYPQVFTNDGP